MSSSSLLDPVPIGQGSAAHSAASLIDTVLEHINDQAVVSLDTLVCLMPDYTWNQIFQAVDDLARRRLIVLRRHRLEYTLFSTHYAA